MFIRGIGNLGALADDRAYHAIYHKTDVLGTSVTGRNSDKTIGFVGAWSLTLEHLLPKFATRIPGDS